ncbi:hypothetical protein G6031_03210 [Dietzia sp. CQ4]|uniref:Gp37-like protein n=1 Tax=Dietzia sp. (strain CQ4) TaxID=370437 RepID=UPI0015FE530A|nr:hypothetical protein [Dietzia sp. CQ4]MBB1033399.1 hypothetical protein [Dietzia sp. CQ4]
MSDWSQERADTIAAGDIVFKLLDKEIEPAADLHGALRWEAPDTVNKVGVFTGEWGGDHAATGAFIPTDLSAVDPQAGWRALVDEAQWILVQAGPSWRDRLVYRVGRIRDHHGRRDDRIEVEAESLYRHVEKIACRSDPSSPTLAVQAKYRDSRRGESKRVLKDYLLVNLLRDFQPGGISGWDQWAPSAWSGILPDRWPIMVNPRMSAIITAYTHLDARFDMAGDLFAETLDAAGLLLTTDLWLEGDPQPFPEYCTLTKPTLILDVVPRGFDTSVTGHIGDMLKGLTRSFSTEQNSPILELGDRPLTHAEVLPWVVWRPKHMNVTSEFTITKSTDWRSTVGGRSPEAINRMLAGTTKSIFQGIGFALAAAVPVFGPLLVAGAAMLGEWVSDLTQDRLFAWSSWTNLARRDAHGRLAYRDQVHAGDGWSLQAMQQGFAALAAGAGSISVAFDVDRSAPFRLFRDFRAGDQCGAEHRGLVFASYVESCSIGAERGRPFQTVALGDPAGRESPVRALGISVKGLANALARVKTFIQ